MQDITKRIYSFSFFSDKNFVPDRSFIKTSSGTFIIINYNFMKSKIWIEIRELWNIDEKKLSSSLYLWEEKKWSNIWLWIPRDIIESLEWIVDRYMTIMWLDTKVYPARVDIWFSQEGELIIYEVTTWFVDQVGSCLQLMDAYNIEWWREKLQSWPMQYWILTVPEYRKEYDLMLDYLREAGIKIDGEVKMNDINTLEELCFVYWYPTPEMTWKENYIPWVKWLAAENKATQLKVLNLLIQGSDMCIPRVFSPEDTEYSNLPCARDTELIFKQIRPKLKWDRNTIIRWKSKQTQWRYESWEMLAQEYTPAYRNKDWKRIEWKVLMVPTATWSQCLWFYSLIDDKKGSDNSIINDWYPQWPWYII